MLVFVELTSGTDVEISQYTKAKTGQWEQTQILHNR